MSSSKQLHVAPLDPVGRLKVWLKDDKHTELNTESHNDNHQERDLEIKENFKFQINQRIFSAGLGLFITPVRTAKESQSSDFLPSFKSQINSEM